MHEIARWMGNSGTAAQAILNMVEIRFCQSKPLRARGWPWYFNLMMVIGIPLLGRTPEMIARTYIWPASAGPGSYGTCIEDYGLISTPSVTVFDELAETLQGIVRGVTKVIRV